MWLPASLHLITLGFQILHRQNRSTSRLLAILFAYSSIHSKTSRFRGGEGWQGGVGEVLNGIFNLAILIPRSCDRFGFRTSGKNRFFKIVQGTCFSCLCFTSQSDIRKNRGWPEVAILSADQKECSLWGRECGLARTVLQSVHNSSARKPTQPTFPKADLVLVQ